MSHRSMDPSTDWTSGTSRQVDWPAEPSIDRVGVRLSIAPDVQTDIHPIIQCSTSLIAFHPPPPTPLLTLLDLPTQTPTQTQARTNEWQRTARRRRQAAGRSTRWSSPGSSICTTRPSPRASRTTRARRTRHVWHVVVVVVYCGWWWGGEWVL